VVKDLRVDRKGILVDLPALFVLVLRQKIRPEVLEDKG
jgi:hypothetical protein